MLKSTSTYESAKSTGSAKNWRGVTTIATGSRLSNQTLEAIQQRKDAEASSIVSLTESGAFDFFKDIEENASSLLNSFLGTELQGQVETLKDKVFNLEAAIVTFRQNLTSARSKLEDKLYSDSHLKLAELQTIIDGYKQRSEVNVKEVAEIFSDQIKSIKSLNGISGKKLVTNTINNFLHQNLPSNGETINLIKSILNDFSRSGVLGSALIQAAPSILAGSIALLETANNQFVADTEEPLTKLDAIISPIKSKLSEIASTATNTIGDELAKITKSLIGNDRYSDDIKKGVRGLVDNYVQGAGLSIKDTSGAEVQPVAGKYSIESGVRIATNSTTEALKREIRSGVETIYPGNVSYETMGGVNSPLASVFIKNIIDHPRIYSPENSRTISSSTNMTFTETDTLKLNVFDTYRKIPGDALKNPELANGESLSSVVIERSALDAIANRKNGFTLGELTDLKRSDKQVFSKRTY